MSQIVENQIILLKKKTDKTRETKKKMPKKSSDVEKPKKRETKKKMPEINSEIINPSPPMNLEGPLLNEKLADLMGELSDLMAKSGDQIRSRVYKRAQETIMSYTDNITDIRQLRGKPGIGPTIMEKLKEYTETGKLELLEREKNNPEFILSNVYGIGPIKAR